MLDRCEAGRTFYKSNEWRGRRSPEIRYEPKATAIRISVPQMKRKKHSLESDAQWAEAGAATAVAVAYENELPELDNLAAVQLEDQFRALLESWRSNTKYTSSSTAIAMDPSYQRIIGMGPNAIPLILREWAQRPEPWHWALRSITGVDPVDSADRGRMGAMREAWRRWAEQSGYLR